MATFVGSLREVQIGKEATRGTAIAPGSGTFLRHTGHTIMPVVEKAEHQGADGTIAQTHEAMIVHESTAGTIPFMLEKSNAWLVAHAICGQDPLTTGANPYTHVYTFDSDNNTHQSFTINYTDPTGGDLKAGRGMLDSLSMTAIHDQYIQVTTEWIADKSADATYTPSYVASPSFFKPSQVTFKHATNFAGLSGASATTVASWDIAVSKNVAPYWVDGSTQPAEIINQRTDIRGTINLLYNDDTFKDLGLSDTTEAIQLAISDGTFGLTLQLPTVYFIDPSPDSDLDAYNTYTIGFVATNADATNGLIKCTVIDGTATH